MIGKGNTILKISAITEGRWCLLFFMTTIIWCVVLALIIKWFLK